MKIAGIGIDIVDCARIKESHFFARLAQYILTNDELQELESRHDPVQFLSSRFAAKEAVIKACPARLSYRDITITKQGLVPCVLLAATLSYEFHLSIAHTETHAVANVLAFEV